MAPRKKVPVERRADSKNGIIESHPSFGSVGLFRTSGSQPLFASPLKLNNGYVTLKIQHAERCRSGVGYDHYYSGETVVEVMLSEAQFAQLITSWNSGSGVPCTLSFIAPGGEGDMPSWPDEDQTSETERVRDEFTDRIEDVKKKVNSSINLMNGLLEKKGALTKAEKDQIKFGMEALRRLLDDTGPFMAEQFVEATERTVQKAMTEIDAFVTQVIRTTGLEALKGMEVAGLKAAEAQEQPLLDKHVDKVTAADLDPYLEGIMSHSEVILPPTEAICSKCYRRFLLENRSSVYVGPPVCDDCERDELRDKGVVD